MTLETVKRNIELYKKNGEEKKLNKALKALERYSSSDSVLSKPEPEEEIKEEKPKKSKKKGD